MSGSLTNVASFARTRIFFSRATYSRIFAIRARTTYRSTTDATLAGVLFEIADLRLEHRHEIGVQTSDSHLKPYPVGRGPLEDQLPFRQHPMGQERLCVVENHYIDIGPVKCRAQVGQ